MSTADILRTLITQQLNEIENVELLDLIYKIITSAS